MKNFYTTVVVCCVCAVFFLPKKSKAQAPFSIKMEVPRLLDSRHDTLYLRPEIHDFGLPGLDSVATLAYTHPGDTTVNTYLGPTLTWEQGDTQRTYVQNIIPNAPGVTGNQSTVHWHGANIPAWTDGGPHQFFYPVASGLFPNTFTPKFKVLDNPCTLWYHPHAEDVTYTQVQMGLAGIIIVKETGDAVDAIAPHTYGHDDFPLIVQDIFFQADTTPAGDTIGYSIDTLKVGPGRTMLVNGTVQPFLDVPAQPVRFRILNGSTRNSYMLSFVTDPSGQGRDTSKVPMALFTSDGGYLPDSVRYTDSIETSPGTRNGVLVDFSQHAGDTLYFMNIYQDLRPNVVGSDDAPTGAKNPVKNVLLQIRVAATTAAPIGAIPQTLPAIPAPPSPSLSRTINLTGKNGGSGTTAFSIDDQQYDFDAINTVVDSGATEHWVIANRTNIAHPFHQHLVQFYVQKVTDTLGNILGELNNPSNPLPLEYLGPKDDILVHENEIVTYSVTFDSYAQPKPFNLDSSAYMYHCHILTHEDGYYSPNWMTISGRSPWGMMQQFAVWNGKISVGAGDVLTKDRFVLFPNPAQEVINLQGESALLSNVCLYDLQGRLLKEKLLPPFQGTAAIDVSGLSAGVVILKWSSAKDQFIKKVVIE